MFNPTIIKKLYLVIILSCFAIAITGCSGANSTIDEVGKWEIVDAGLPAALISIWGSSVDDIWVVGADSGDGIGPMVLHREKGRWSRINTGRTGDLWWVFGFDEGPIFMGGENGMILRKDGDVMKLMETPGRATVYGIWGTSPNDLWAVGGNVIDGGLYGGIREINGLNCLNCLKISKLIIQCLKFGARKLMTYGLSDLVE